MLAIDWEATRFDLSPNPSPTRRGALNFPSCGTAQRAIPQVSIMLLTIKRVYQPDLV
jgi:hypothetical protein